MPDEVFTGFELLDHTADIALHVAADSIERLFRYAADGLYVVVGELVTSSDSHPTAFRFEAGDVESLLHDFLAELLFLLETRRVRLADFTFACLDDNVCDVTASAADIDAQASTFDREVKAVTYHDLSVIRRAGRFETTIILDI